ncbi:MAG: glycosyltransferase [Limisphaerales bacterium]
MQKSYILLTAAKNEENYIGEAIESVIRQSVLPLAWFIVDDGSTDQTAKIVRNYAEKHSFIHLHSVGVDSPRSFGAKDKAINFAYQSAKNLKFDLIGIQDADIAPAKTGYYESIIEQFENNPGLGIAGGYIYERKAGIWRCRAGNSDDSVAGGIQMFRRECFEKIGGYTPLHHGGEDWLAQLDAKMAGWEVLACPELHALHYRPTSSAGGHWRGLFRLGLMDASFGSHPLFEIFKCVRRIAAQPIVLGSFLRLCGFFWWKISGRQPVITSEKVAFLRSQQWVKLKSKIWRHGNRMRTQVNQPSIP